jgi:hypothetical protein
VALCSWNGEQFIDEQLESLAWQMRVPDELIICDDASSDSTIAKLQRFAAKASFTVRIQRNTERFGVARNFEQAISLCTGELILLADQDDVWRPEKITRIVQAFEHDPEIDCIFTDAELIDQVGKSMRKGLWRTIGFDLAEQAMVRMGRALDVLSVHNVATGATMAFHRRILPSVLPFPRMTGLLHDRWIAISVAATGRLDCIKEPLILYRQHRGQHLGAGPESHRLLTWLQEGTATGSEQYAAWATELEIVATHLHELGIGRTHVKGIEDRVNHLRVRAGLPASRIHRIGAIARELRNRRYHRFSNGYVSLIKDLLRRI